MRVESMSSRLDFDERRARALEGVVQYRPGAVPPHLAADSRHAASDAEQNERRTRGAAAAASQSPRVGPRRSRDLGRERWRTGRG